MVILGSGRSGDGDGSGNSCMRGVVVYRQQSRLLFFGGFFLARKASGGFRREGGGVLSWVQRVLRKRGMSDVERAFAFCLDWPPHTRAREGSRRPIGPLVHRARAAALAPPCQRLDKRINAMHIIIDIQYVRSMVSTIGASALSS